jgi:hypothetical protein
MVATNREFANGWVSRERKLELNDYALDLLGPKPDYRIFSFSENP